MRSFYIFLSLALSLVVIKFCLDKLIYVDDVYYYAFSDTLSLERIDKLLSNKKEFAWVGYLLTPVFLALKVFLVSVCLYCGLFFNNEKTSLASLYKIALRAEFVFLVPLVLKLVWFTVIQPNYTLEEVNNFPPLSLKNILDGSYEVWITYPLSILNLFEVIYIIVLSQVMARELNASFAKSLKWVIQSYGTGLLLWIMLILFVLISLS